MADHLLIDVFDGMKAKSGTAISRFFTRRLEVRNMMYFFDLRSAVNYTLHGNFGTQDPTKPLRTVAL